MNANVAVSEPKPPVDDDSSLSYTMEGFRGLPPSSMIPFFWAPGWNSVQSVNKYQQEIGGALRGGDPGVKLLNSENKNGVEYFSVVPEAFVPEDDHLLMVPLHFIFGSEELSAQAASVSERVPKPFIAVNPADAANLKVQEGTDLEFEIEHHTYKLPVKFNPTLLKGTAGLPYRLPGLPFVELPAWGILKK
jgi:NADH-quinone oxidoreductase subunit G